MKLASKQEKFEVALQLKNQIDAINYVVSGWNNLNNLFQDINLPEDKQSSAIHELITTLNPYFSLTKINRLECFDISQMGTRHFVGSMVVWQNGQIDKNEYRKFKINTKTTPDDQFMIKEVIWRRLRHPEWPYPDIIIVDGGKPQVTAANEVFKTYNQFPLISSREGVGGWVLFIIGLAKRLETIVIRNGDEFIEINLPQNSTALNLLKSLRDEAHRFANKYRRELMKKSLPQ
jgi:excinuclease ABC subunit C